MADNTTDMMTLGNTAIGKRVTVTGFREGAPSRRLLEMGFVPGTEVLVVRSAPLGDPIEYAVMGGRVAMRRTDAAAIFVEETR